MDNDDRETRIVEVSLEEAVDNDTEGFLDLLDELFFAQEDEETRGHLGNITYRVVGLTPDGLLKIAVTADPDRPELDEEGETP